MSPATMVPVGADALETVRAGLAVAAEGAAAAGMPRPECRGQLLRPLLAYGASRSVDGGAPAEGFWAGALAVQLAHEASLVHDDIIDQAATRRGAPTVAATKGIGPALVLGDHLLSAAYRMAAETGSLAYARLFARAVERTIAGEAAQGRAAGRRLTWDEYRDIALGKAGELMGCAVALPALLTGRADAEAHFELGRRMGLVYQMLDDVLDYCPAAETGKPALGDYAQGRWTWLLDEIDGIALGGSADDVAARLHAADADGRTPLRRCLARLEAEAEALVADIRAALPGDDTLSSLVRQWIDGARQAVEREEATRQPSVETQVSPSPAERGQGAGGRGPSPVEETLLPGIVVIRPPSDRLLSRVPAAKDWERYFAVNSRSFRFAARFFPPGEWERVARVYAFCRVTDDLVDTGEADAEEMLDEWTHLSRRAYEGRETGIALLDRLMRETASAAVPFTYAAELAEGMRMDLRARRYANMAELRVYTYRVASVVGLWITELSGVHTPRVLEKAAEMGHAMQLTNILRDVGEDWRRGRLYLPADHLETHGISEDAIEGMCRGDAPGPAYRRMTEELMRSAEASYAAAFPAIRELPAAFRRPVAVAAHVYRGIHAPLRRAGYDNLRRRAVTSGAAKAMLAARALWDLWRLERRPAPAGAADGDPRDAAPVRLAGA
ncbi:squalene/phytoene synthase family protein [Longimicrobium sp.]|uniref:squalene/phytoene synthase family protein n=1 Tax=Longimicrobium sp. TaxID=2029185 RepID=UPI002E365F8C|nr:squalene/phytoene synthase family protein [Longimicrobium sp.]HEX6036582.1 squalene/phytoene synthase family protein [Longimicrobium sp.]